MEKRSTYFMLIHTIVQAMRKGVGSHASQTSRNGKDPRLFLLQFVDQSLWVPEKEVLARGDS